VIVHSPGVSRLLGLLRDCSPLSFGDLSVRLQVTRPRLTDELDRLRAIGLVQWPGTANARDNRGPAVVELHPDIRFAAVDVGTTSIDVEVTDGRLAPVVAYAEPADIRSGPKVVLGRVREILAKFRVDGAYGRLHAIGIGLPGLVSFRDGFAVGAPVMPGWARYPVGEVLGREHACPVVVDNDANIMAIGERHSGVARSVDNLLFVKIGTRVGCGIVLNGHLYRGADGRAGEIGHIPVDSRGPVCPCGNVGCLDMLVSGGALGRMGIAAARAGTSPALAARFADAGLVTARDVAQAMAAGDPVCVELARTGGRRLGTVLAGLVNIVNPAMIVIGGGVAGLGHPLLTEIRSVVYRRSMPVATGDLPIVRSELGPRAGVVGAAVLASELAYGPVGDV
jgi:glucokinase-like ROK family protein